jgi:BirA family biotin operon repressor/biotin-[acetyl-CoA-carboxylase] ligase
MTRFSAERFLTALGSGGHAADREVHALDAVDSTSSELVRRITAGAAVGTVVIAELQEQGRGRSGRSWFSPRGGGLYISLAVAVDPGPDSALTAVPLAAGVAAVDAVAQAGLEPPLLKWPNDLLVNDRKVGGILCEVADPRARPGIVVVGLGLNLGPMAFPDELGFAASLAEAGSALAREPLAAAWVGRLEGWIGRIDEPQGRSPLIEAWRRRAEPFGRQVRVGDMEGETVDLDSSGRLLIRRADRMVVAVAGGIVENVATDEP